MEQKALFPCENCGEQSDLHETDDGDICDKCAVDLQYVQCEDCGTYVKENSTIQYDGNYICEDCGDNYSYCDHCETYQLSDSSVCLQDESTVYCGECFDRHGFTCEDCGQAFTSDSSVRTANGSSICQGCYENSYFTCEDCGDVFHDDYMCCNDNGCYCEGCGSDNDIIHKYHHKPHLIFHGDKGKLKLGFELEVEGNRDCAEDIISQWSDNENRFWLEDDSSIQNGFEIVTHPGTLEYYESDFPLKELSAYLTENHFKSHNTTTCGLHIHCNKAYLTETDQIKMGLFVGFNSDELKNFGRRDYNSYCHEKKIERLKDANLSPSRYEAINFTNDRTIEFRFMRGTVKADTILASLQFVHALCHYVKANGFPTIIKPCWKEFVTFCQADKRYKTLVTYMEHRHLLGGK